MSKAGLTIALLSFFLLTVNSALAGPFGLKAPLQNGVKPPAPIVIRDKWALLIGLTKYQDGNIASVKQTTANLALLSKVLKNPNAGRFSDDHITALFDVQATKKYIEYVATEGWLVKKALPGDLIVFYISGRAVYKDDDAVICTYDTVANSAASTGVSLKDLLAEVHRRTQCKNIVCVLDLVPLTELQATPPRDLWQKIAGAGKVTILAASAPGFLSNPANLMGTLFTNYLAEGLQTGGGAMTLDAIAQYVCQSVETDARTQLHKVQQPQLIISPENKEMAAVVLGHPSKVAQSRVSFGHPVDQLALSRPDLMPHEPGAKSISKHVDADDDDDDADSGQGVDFSTYMVKMKKDIQSKWKPPKGIEQRKVVATFTINRDGSIVEPSIVDGSGLENIDKSALAALHDASPLDPLPKGAPRSVQIRYVFDWRVSHQ